MRSYTGLDPALVRRLDGRVDIATYLREIRRNTGQVGSVYDSNVTAYDPFPASADANYNDPLLDGIIAPTTSAAVDFITNQVGWKTDAHYETLSYDVNKAWDRDRTDAPVTDLRKAIANDPKMAVMIAHGWDDLSCPYFTSKLIDRPDAELRPGAAHQAPRLSGRAHVLRSSGQRAGVQARRDGDLRRALIACQHGRTDAPLPRANWGRVPCT